jgi:CheY-like chemotaxis protein
MGWAHLLRDKHHDVSAIAGGLEVIRRNAKTQARLVDDILDVSRIITGKLHVLATPVDLSAVVEEALDAIRPTAAGRGILLSVDGLARGCTVEGDAERLQQVAWNLLSNAIKFTEEGGAVRVELTANHTHATLTVSDTGRGIEQEFLPHVFERFSQADSSTTRRFGGLGLGLAIVRHIVEVHGGYIAATSAGPGLGSTFRVDLPLCDRPTAEPDPVSSGPSYFANTGERSVIECALGRSQLLDGIRVLVVDDAPDARDLVEVALMERGAAVASAGSVSEALELFETFQPHALVSDIGMPEEDGYALIARIRARPLELGGGIKAIALTAYTRAEDRAQARASGFDDHLAKPAHPDRIAHVLRQLVDSSPSELVS